MSFSNVAGCDAKLFSKLREPLKCPLSLVAMPGMHEAALVWGRPSPALNLNPNKFHAPRSRRDGLFVASASADGWSIRLR
jgi:hypothetical protein